MVADADDGAVDGDGATKAEISSSRNSETIVTATTRRSLDG